MHRRAVAEIVATLALLGVTVGLSGGLAAAYYGWLHSYSAQSSIVNGEVTRLASSRIYVISSAAGTPARVWLLNSGDSTVEVTSVYSDGALQRAGQWLLVDAATGQSSSGLSPGHLYQLWVNSSSSVVVYIDGILRVESAVGP